VILLQAAQWLAVEEKIARAVAARRAWQEQMRREWEQFIRESVTTNTLRPG